MGGDASDSDCQSGSGEGRLKSGLCAGGPWDGKLYAAQDDIERISIPLLRGDCYVAHYEWKDKLSIWLWRGPSDVMPPSKEKI